MKTGKNKKKKGSAVELPEVKDASPPPIVPLVEKKSEVKQEPKNKV